MKYKDVVKIIKEQIKSAKKFGISSPTVEQHIKVLKASGIKIEDEPTWADKTYGPVCSCGVRHTFIVSRGTNLPKGNSLNCPNKIKSDYAKK